MIAIIPIAGLGTRCLPFSKVIPKAMLPVSDKPCVQWIVEELSQAGIKDIIFVYSKGQEMVKEYFSEKTWYDEELEQRGLQQQAEELSNVRNLARFQFVEQQEQLGDGHAILQAKKLVPPNEPFLVIFGDSLYSGDQVISKLIQQGEEKNQCIVAVQEIPPELTNQYGIIEFGKNNTIQSMIEKPESEKSPSNLAMIGRYFLTTTIWSHLEKQYSASGEVRLIDALQSLQAEEEISGLQLKGTWLDTGTLEGIKNANSEFKA